MSEQLTRIAIVSDENCKPKKCKQECKKTCPVNRNGKLCIEVMPDSRIASISETLCIGCGMCVEKCPFDAIQIINIPTKLEQETTHRYGANSFKLHRLPTPKPGNVLGLVGTNGIGKSTALKILSGKVKPNLGRFKTPPEWSEVLAHFRGSELQAYFTRLLEDKLQAIIKIQYVDALGKKFRGTVGQLLREKDERNMLDYYLEQLELKDLVNREIEFLSGGELQRLCIAAVCIRKADIYMFDEPSSYLDVKQRLTSARLLRGLVDEKNYLIAV